MATSFKDKIRLFFIYNQKVGQNKQLTDEKIYTKVAQSCHQCFKQ